MIFLNSCVMSQPMIIYFGVVLVLFLLFIIRKKRSHVHAHYIHYDAKRIIPTTLSKR